MVICGSTAENSHTRALLKELTQELSQLQVPVVNWDLRDLPLPIADPTFHSNPEQHPDLQVRRFIEAARASDGFALGSPLYHGSFSGVLKNALDHLWYDAFRNKPVALLSHGSSERRASLPNVALQPIVSTLFGYVVQAQIATGPSDYRKSPEGKIQLQNEDIRTRVTRQAQELVRLARSLKADPK